ncbi:MAG TPA: adenine deaminase [Chloroflexia bacterium]|nr:adenine deaminase [Chloroflexia bacterium]
MVKSFDYTAGDLQRLLQVARGEAQADMVLTGGQLVNVLSGEIYPAEVAICGDRIAGVSVVPGQYQGHETMDLGGDYIAPGLIDAHVHIESSLLLPVEYANAVLPCGTTAVISDPHEIANVHGLNGIRFMLKASEGLALRVFVMLSSCVPATDMETSGACLTAADLVSLVGEPRVLGVAEMMNYPGVICGAPDMVEKALMGHERGIPVDGHAPLVRGQSLQAYIAAGITSDHESVGPDEALEKLRSGLQVLIREGSTAKNLDALLPIVNGRTARFCSFATDDKQPADLEKEGHIDHIIRRAVAAGLDPVLAIQMATVNTARHYGLRDMGAVAPGCFADLITFADLEDLRVTRTFASGRMVAENGKLLERQTNSTLLPPNRIVTPGLSKESFAIKAEGKSARVILARPEQIVTGSAIEDVVSIGGYVVASPDRDLLKIAVVERHAGTGNVGVGLLRGFGLKRGAMASSVAHDSHNVVVVGTSDEDMLLAVSTVVGMSGGICAVESGGVLAALPLPVAGLMSDAPLDRVRDGMDRLLDAARSLGCQLDNPYMAMAFLALPVIPELKITDKGLVDVSAFQLVPLFID